MWLGAPVMLGGLGGMLPRIFFISRSEIVHSGLFWPGKGLLLFEYHNIFLSVDTLINIARSPVPTALHIIVVQVDQHTNGISTAGVWILLLVWQYFLLFVCWTNQNCVFFLHLLLKVCLNCISNYFFRFLVAWNFRKKTRQPTFSQRSKSRDACKKSVPFYLHAMTLVSSQI